MNCLGCSVIFAKTSGGSQECGTHSFIQCKLTVQLSAADDHGLTPVLILVRVLGASWDKGCMAASASGNIVAGLRNQIRLVGVYGQLVTSCYPGLRLPL
jgi:hypothetical protein